MMQLRDDYKEHRREKKALVRIAKQEGIKYIKDSTQRRRDAKEDAAQNGSERLGETAER